MPATLKPMAKRKSPPAGAEKPEKEVLYLEVEPAVRARLRRLGRLPHRSRTMSAEAIVAIYAYLAAEEQKEGLGPIGEGE